jgi:hypothetical protein
METLLSISIVVAIVMWAGLALATFLGKIVSDLLPFMKVGNEQGAGDSSELKQDHTVSSERKELAMVA